MFGPGDGPAWWSAPLALAPWAVVFGLLVAVRAPAWGATLVALPAGVGLAEAAFGMPAELASAAAAQGAVVGLVSVAWVVVNAVWVVELTIVGGHLPALRRCLAAVSPDQRVHAVLIPFSLGALLAGVAGVAASVAVCGIWLLGVGLRPWRAASVALVAVTAPVALGAAGAVASGPPAGADGGPAGAAAWAAVLLVLVTPFVVVAMVDGLRGLQQAWSVALVAGAAFAAVRYTAVALGLVTSADVVAAIVTAAAIVTLVRLRPPPRARRTIPTPVGAAAVGAATVTVTDRPDAGPAVSDVGSDADRRAHADGSAAAPRRADSAQLGRVAVPYLVVAVVFAAARIPAVAGRLGSWTVTVPRSGLPVLDAILRPPAVSTLYWAASPGTLLLVAGLVIAAVLRLSPMRALHAWLRTLARLTGALVAIVAVGALGQVFVLSGQAVFLGGWLGRVASQVGTAPELVAAGVVSAAALAPVVSVQNLAVAASAVGRPGDEGPVLRRAFAAGLPVLVLSCLLLAAPALLVRTVP